jgi:hypothetical protein
VNDTFIRSTKSFRNDIIQPWATALVKGSSNLQELRCLEILVTPYAAQAISRLETTHGKGSLVIEFLFLFYDSILLSITLEGQILGRAYEKVLEL